MIKYLKLLVFAFVFALLGFGFSSAGKVQEVSLNMYPSAYVSGYSVGFLKGGGLLSSSLGTSRGFLVLSGNAFFWWDPDGLPYFYHPNFQGRFGQYFVCDLITGGTTGNPTNCTSVSINYNNIQGYLSIFENFFNNVVNGDLAYYDFNYVHSSSPNGYTYIDKIQVCFNSESIGNSICFRYGRFSYSQGTAPSNYGSLTGSKNYTGLNFVTIPYSYYGPAPGQSTYGQSEGTYSGNYVLTNAENDDIINYYESYYNWNESMCFVNVTDLDSVYGQLWETGTGQTNIFDMFKHYYDRLPASDGYTIIGRWLDFYLTNYDQWFNTNGSPRYLLVGSPLSNPPSMIFSGFTPPFTNVPAALFFLADHQANYLSQISSNYYGREIAQYCDIKLNGNNSYTLLTGNVATRINDWNSTIGNGPVVDQSGNRVDYQKPTDTFNGGTSGFWSRTYNVSSGSVDFSTNFSNFFSQFSAVFDQVNYRNIGIIPDYILFFLAFIILFKVFKK